jgi:hypothetical protein
MPVFRAQIHYAFGASGKWSNVWHVSTDNLTAAEFGVRTVIVPDLLPLLHNRCQLVSILVSDDSSSEFITTPINAAGTSDVTDELLPLYNSAKVLFSDGSLGRPDYKFFKGLLTELMQADGVIGSGVASDIDALVETLITDADGAAVPLVSLDNDQYTSASVQPAVQMRQMHRKRRRAVVVP